ncbi:MAG TPA: carboxypeptidase regulatory-like domain-containing protein, partial [Thermoanaerobaculia bacterium]
EPKDRGGPRWRLAERSGVTDGNGRLALRRRRDERLKLVAVSPAFLGEGAVWKGGSQPLVFVTNPVSKLEVRAGDGKPVAGALVLWRSWPIGLTGLEAQIELAVPPGDEPLRVEAGDGGAAQVPAGSKAALLPVRLEPPRLVEGQVLQQNSPKPVPNALVWAGSRLPAPPVRAGADGKFRLLVSTVEEASLEAAAPGYLPESQLIPRATPAAQARPAVLRLEPAARIAGQVLDTAGNPVPRAYVRIGMQGFRGLTLSRASGRFQISGLQFQKIYVIEGFHRDYTGGEAAAQTAAPGQSAPFVKLVLRSGVTAFGHVVDGDGKPLPGVRVMLISGRSKQFWATTDAAGRFEVKAVDTGGLTLRARTPGFSPLSRPIEIPPGTPRVDLGAIELPASAVVEGEVTDNRGTPIAGASVESSFSSSDPLQRVEDPASPPLEVKTSPEGRFRLTDLPRDTPFRLQIEHEGYIPLRVSGVKAPLRAPLHLEMRTARGLTGRVVGPEGEPVGGATLSRVEESNEGVSARGESELGITDARGGFQISGFEPGPNDLRVQAEGYATKTVRGVMIPVDRDLEGLEIVLGRGVILEVRVLSGEGEPVAGASVDLYPDRDAFGPTAMERFPPMSRWLRTDDWGTCRAELPEPGRYWVSTSADQGS